MKKIVSIHRGPPAHWVGNGFHVSSLFTYDQQPEAFSPFLLLDYGAPEQFPPSSERRGVGQHPHRGFETVTVAYQGGVEHRDSAGNHGTIGPGDVQWMTAASGLIHEEFHSPAFAERVRAIGSEPMSGSTEQFAKFIRDESSKWAGVIKRAGAKID